jgi:hypothetical protein
MVAAGEHEGSPQLERVMKELGIEPDHLVECAYIDLLIRRGF